jgi:hypothetical protein
VERLVPKSLDVYFLCNNCGGQKFKTTCLKPFGAAIPSALGQSRLDLLQQFECNRRAVELQPCVLVKPPQGLAGGCVPISVGRAKSNLGAT